MAFNFQFSLSRTTRHKFDLAQVDDDLIEVGSKQRVPDEIIISDDEDETPNVVISVEDDDTPKNPTPPDSDITKKIIILDDDNETPKEIISLDEDDEMATSWDGTGKENDPLVFTEWTTGNVISASDNSKVFEIEDDEDDNESEKCDAVNTQYSGASKEDELDDVPDLSLSQESIITEHEAMPTLSSYGRNLLQAISPTKSLGIADEEGHFSQNTSLSMMESPHCLKQNGPMISCRFDKEQLPTYSASLIAKKRLFYHTYGPEMLPELKKKVDYHLQFVPIKQSNQECWICIDGLPPTPKYHNIQKSVYFRHKGESLKLGVHIGFISMMLEGILTDEAKEGIIEQRWSASHLCGNWTCINPYHIQAEPGPINSSRNGCLPHKDRPCLHTPRCLKHLYISGNLREITRESLLTGNYR